MTGENFKNHLVFEKLEQYKQSLSSEGYHEFIDNENNIFFSSAYEFIIDRLNLAIPTLVQESELATLSAEIETATTNINTFSGSNNNGYLSNASNSIYSALTKVRNLPIVLSGSHFDFSKIIAHFQETVSGAYSELGSISSGVRSELSLIQSELEYKKIEIASLQQGITAREIDIQNIFSQYKLDFEILKNANSTLLESDRKSYNDLFNEDLDSNKTSFEKLRGSLEEQTDRTVSLLGDKLEEANKIVNIVGNIGVTGNYQNIANEHKANANLFRWFALMFMVVMSLLLIWSIIELSNNDFNPLKTLIRILAAAVLTYPAVYVARESSKHRKLETENRKLELELASIGPFIELLPEEKKQQIKEELIKKYFGNGVLDSTSREDEEISINGLEKILKVILPFVKK